MRKKILKKAQVEVTFHWIFILIAGVAILAFFLMVTKNQKRGAGDELEAIVGSRFEAIISAIQKNPDSVNVQDMTNIELRFRCEVDGHTYSLSSGNRRFGLDSEIIFSPEMVGGAETVAWTKLYATPYPTVQMLYFTDEKTQYIFLESANEYYLKMPEQMEKKLVNSNELETLKDEGFRKYIIITNDPGYTGDALISELKRKSDVVKIISLSRVEFLENPTDTEGIVRPYANEETLFGAIISGNPALYDCAMEKIMYASRIAGEMNLQREEMIKANLTSTSTCGNYYQTGIPADYIKSIIGNSTYDNTTTSYLQLQDSVTSLSNLNRELARSNCPTIY